MVSKLHYHSLDLVSFPYFSMKKFFFSLVSLTLLAACAQKPADDAMMDDDTDPAAMEDDAMMEEDMENEDQ